MELTKDNNKALKKSLVHAYWPIFLVILISNLTWVLTSIAISGIYIPKLKAKGVLYPVKALAALSVADPIPTIVICLSAAVGFGMIFRCGNLLGKGKKQAVRQVWTSSFYLIVLMSIVSSIILYTCAKYLVLPFGGSADGEIRQYSAEYVKGMSLLLPFYLLMNFFCNTLNLNGEYKHSVWTIIIYSVTTFISMCVCCYFFIDLKIFGSPLGLGAVSIGSGIGGLFGCIYAIIIFKIKKIRLSINPKNIRIKGLFSQYFSGIAAPSAELVWCIMNIVTNNIILYAKCWKDPQEAAYALAVLTVIDSIWFFTQVPGDAADNAAGSSFSILYGAKDRNGIRRLYSFYSKFILILQAIWILLVFVFFEPVFYLYSEGGIGKMVVFKMMLLTLPFLLFYSLTNLKAVLLESTNHPVYSLIISSFVELIYAPIVYYTVLNFTNLKIYGLSIGYALGYVIILVLDYIFLQIKTKSFIVKYDDILYLNNSDLDNHPILDVSVKGVENEVDEISQSIHDFFREQKVSEKNSSVVSRMIKEISNNLLSNVQTSENDSVDIKIILDKKTLRIIIRARGKKYDRRRNSYDENELVKEIRELAKKIRYDYLVHMNIVSIDFPHNISDKIVEKTSDIISGSNSI